MYPEAPRRGQPAPGQRGRKLGSPPALWGSQSQGHVIRPWEPAEVVRVWPTHPFDDDALRKWQIHSERSSVAGDGAANAQRNTVVENRAR